MPEMTTYEPNQLCWVDLQSADVDGAKEFYGGLFGWESETMTAPAANGYTMFRLNGKIVAAVGPRMNDQFPSTWSNYVSVPDAEKTAQLVEEAGGQVLVPPMDVFEEGRLAVFVDSAGAAICVWQPKKTKGAELMGEDNTWVWSELHTRDTQKSAEFYRRVFEWDAQPESGEPPYNQFYLQGRPFAGMFDGTKQLPPDVPANWMTYFGTADLSATMERAGALGASVVLPRMEWKGGSFAILADHSQAAFGLIQRA